MSPFVLKNVTLRNRIVSTSHEPAYSEDGLFKDRYRAYHGDLDRVLRDFVDVAQGP